MNKRVYGNQNFELILSLAVFEPNTKNNKICLSSGKITICFEFSIQTPTTKNHLISKANFFFSCEPKTERKCFLISALASKKSSNKL